jgi:alkanesulfonate monooxygenase SsuD/methylene tetrahydromethanopterin reductase-like flavin-dependent oxidoreductase (luciferase family)
MKLGYAPTFQNSFRARPDHDVWEDEMHLTSVAIEGGFDSIWATEHHFTDYEMSPHPLQYLSWACGRFRDVAVGTMVLVLPWHDPLRIIEEVVVLDHLAEGKFTLGIGRGVCEFEFQGLRIPMNESSERFDEVAEIVLEAFETGRIDAKRRKYYDFPAREIRPEPFRSLTGRLYGAPSVSSLETMVRMGAGLLLSPTKSLDDNAEDIAQHAAEWAKARSDVPAPQPLIHQFVYVHDDADQARHGARTYLDAYLREYREHHKVGTSGVQHVDEFIDRNACGTPDQVIEKLAEAGRRLQPKTILVHAFFGGMTRDVAATSLRLLTKNVIPVLKDL